MRIYFNIKATWQVSDAYLDIVSGNEGHELKYTYLYLLY